MTDIPEIIQRSGPILEILARQDVLTEEDLSLCLDCIMKEHFVVATKIMELLTGAALTLLPHHVDTILTFFRSLELDKCDINLIPHIILFLEKMTKASLQDFH